MGFPEGCKSITFNKVSGRVSPPWGGILPNYPILWKWAEFHHISWKCGDLAPFSAPWGGNGARAAPGWKHQRNLSFSYAFLGVPGTEKCVSGWIFTKNAVSGAFFGENHQNGWNSAEFHHFHQISRFRAFPAARAPKRAWNLHVLQRVLQGPPGTGVNADCT